MGSDNEAKGSNADYCVDHSYYAKWFSFMGGLGGNVGDSAKCREDENVYLWVAKESEKMLVEDWVSSADGMKE